MSKIRVVIVDDSSFSIAFIRDILEEHGFEVVGEAGSLEEVKEVVREKMPSLVTMDMTLPGTDGFECTRAIHKIDENIKVIVVSSMMDDEIVQEAKNNKVSAYVQKPVDADELVTAINRVMASDELYQFLEEEYFAVFKEALMDGLNRMTKTLLTYKEEYPCTKEHESKGMTIIIGIIGKFSGRMLFDLSKATANNIATAILRREPKNIDEVVAALGEFTNIVSGNACSILNKKNKALGLRVAPPSILHGDSVLISAPSFNTTTAISETNYGELLLNVGFQRGEEKVDVKHVNPFVESFAAIMPQLGFTTVRKGNLSVKSKELTGSGVIIIVGIVGAIRGNVVYCLSLDDAKKVASTMMMGMPVTEFDDMSKSALSELTNMLTANAATCFSNIDIPIDISTPTLLHGENISVKMSSNQVLAIQLFADDIPIDINIAFEN